MPCLFSILRAIHRGQLFTTSLISLNMNRILTFQVSSPDERPPCSSDVLYAGRTSVRALEEYDVELSGGFALTTAQDRPCFGAFPR